MSVDKRKEFHKKHMQGLVELYSTENEEKSCAVERWNRTIKEKMFTYFPPNPTTVHAVVLDEMTKQYNAFLMLRGPRCLIIQFASPNRLALSIQSLKRLSKFMIILLLRNYTLLFYQREFKLLVLPFTHRDLQTRIKEWTPACFLLYSAISVNYIFICLELSIPVFILLIIP